MKFKSLLTVCATGVLLLSSCIKDEPMFKETDIISFEMEGQHFISANDPRNTDKIDAIVSPNADLTKLVPIFKVSPGATVKPESGIAQDFSKGDVDYIVTSEDGNYTKKYIVSVTKSNTVKLKFDFELWDVTSKKYNILQTPRNGGEPIKLWDSGNPGIAIVLPSGNSFPTRRGLEPYRGKYAAVLETQYGGVKFGNINIPIFSGSLFYGSFGKIDMNDPRKSLQMGQPHPKESGKPTIFSGYYQYKAGEKYTYLDAQGNEVTTTDIKDQQDMYAIIFKVTKNAGANEYLDGITVLNSDKIVASAKWKPETAKDTDTPAENGYTKFTIPFEYLDNKELDFVNNDYKLIITFASSKDGNEYKGSIGSKLVVDEVEVICDAL